MHVLLAIVFSALVAQVYQSPSPSPTPAPARQKLTISIPNGWVRTESGRYNEWRAPNGMSDFRVSVLPNNPAFHGPDAAGAVKAMFQKTVAQFNSTATIAVKTVRVCNGQEDGYRVDDPLGTASQGFMMIVPGSESAGLINYEVLPGAKADPAIQSTVDKLCWP